MHDITLHAPMLDQLDCAVALADRDSWSIEFANARFEEWFPPEGGAALNERVPAIVRAKAEPRLAAGKAFTAEVELRRGARSVILALALRPVEIGGRTCLLLEGQDASKRRQAEHMLDSYARMAERHARELARTKERAEKLLLNVMPRSVYEELKEYGAAIPQRIEDASVLMVDVVGFTDMALAHEPQALFAELNDVFTAFDRITDLVGCERIKTIGDGYVAVAGLVDPGPDDAANLARAALRMRRYLERRNTQHDSRWACRFGLATGSLIGALVGVQKYVFDVFGPAVNLASRLECRAQPMQILVAAETRTRLRDEFLLTSQGPVAIKGFGECEVFALEDEARGGVA